jgi:hypothetical protein
VEAYFGKVQRVNAAFNDKLLSYFDDVLRTARSSPRHLVCGVRSLCNSVYACCNLRLPARVPGRRAADRALVAALPRLRVARALFFFCLLCTHGAVCALLLACLPACLPARLLACLPCCMLVTTPHACRLQAAHERLGSDRACGCRCAS